MKLIELLSEVPGVGPIGLPSIEVEGITADSRQIQPGGLFIAIQGTSDNGHQYLASAEQAGAVAALGQEPDPGLSIPYLQAEDSRLAYAHLAAAWHAFPARKLVMIGITGTDGKTTTAMMIFDILRRAGLAAGLVSTVSANISGETLDTGLHVTTPDPMDLQSLLRRMVEEGLTHSVLEITSHGLAQHRVAACEIDVGVVTNITHEHLDFHGSYEAYREAKGRLISGLSQSAAKPGTPEKSAVLNMDDESYAFLDQLVRVRRVTYGFDPGADVRGSELETGSDGIHLTIEGGGQKTNVGTSTVGAYNAANVLAAFATAVNVLGIDAVVVGAALSEFAGVPGRMEQIDLGQDFLAIVDFAHTPNALKQALTSARSLTEGRVISVFGSAGLRDRAKRRMMAEISAELADLSILTAEDPRTEPLEDILEEMAEGARSKGGREDSTFWRVPDRGNAIRRAIELARPGDLVIACGKGHEQSMCFGVTEFPWDDRVAMRAAVAEHLGNPGPAMPELPTSGDQRTPYASLPADPLHSVLFVCTANMCRSPMAEALFDEIIRNEGEADDWRIDSAGVSAFDGEQVTNNTQIVAAERGLDLSAHRSKLVSRQVVEPFSLVLVMEERHREMMRVAYPELSKRIYLLREIIGGEGDVHDPIGTDIVNYRAMAGEVNSILTKGLERIRELASESREE